MKEFPRILVVDDAPEIRDIHSRFLHAIGIEVLTAENGLVALDVARRAAPDVVVTDLDMPLMDGLTLCRRLRVEPAIHRVAVVIVAGNAPEQTEAALDAGCDAVLCKPCSKTLLLATIQLLLDRRAASPAWWNSSRISTRRA